MRFWIKGEGDRIDFSYVEEGDRESCEECLTKDIRGKCHKGRYACRGSNSGSQFIFCHDKNVVGKQAKHISRITTQAFPSLAQAAKKKGEMVNRIETIAYHNAKKMNASIGQKIDRFFPDLGRSSYEQKREVFEKKISESPSRFAREIIGVRKIVEQVEAEYNLIDVLDLDQPFRKADLTYLKVHKLVVLGFYLYQEDLVDNKIYVDVSESDVSVKVDYGVAKSAIGQIFNNAVKYCKRDTKLSVDISESDDFVEISFQMTSLHFENEDVGSLMSLGGRGNEAVHQPGDGTGLFAVNQFMRMHHGYFKMHSNSATCFRSDGKQYSENSFVLGFAK